MKRPSAVLLILMAILVSACSGSTAILANPAAVRPVIAAPTPPRAGRPTPFPSSCPATTARTTV